MTLDEKAFIAALEEEYGYSTGFSDNELEDKRDIITAYRRAREEQGYVEAPKKATVKMMSAAQSAWLRDPLRRTTTMYEAMLAARPQKETDQ